MIPSKPGILERQQQQHSSCSWSPSLQQLGREKEESETDYGDLWCHTDGGKCEQAYLYVCVIVPSENCTPLSAHSCRWHWSYTLLHIYSKSWRRLEKNKHYAACQLKQLLNISNEWVPVATELTLSLSAEADADRCQWSDICGDTLVLTVCDGLFLWQVVYDCLASGFRVCSWVSVLLELLLCHQVCPQLPVQCGSCRDRAN